jgi:hypothetical protein
MSHPVAAWHSRMLSWMLVRTGVSKLSRIARGGDFAERGKCQAIQGAGQLPPESRTGWPQHQQMDNARKWEQVTTEAY